MDLMNVTTIYKVFLDEGLSALKQLQDTTQMQDDHYANAASQIIIGAMSNSIQTIEVLQRIDSMIIDDTIKQGQNAKDLLMKDAQLASEIANKELRVQQKASMIIDDTIKNDTATKDIAIKAQQVIGETIKNGSGNTANSIYTAQLNKMLADINFTNEQKLQLGYSVTYNNRIKVSEKYVETLGNLGLGGLVVPASMWKTYFDMAANLYTNNGSAPASPNVIYPDSGTTVSTKVV